MAKMVGTGIEIDYKELILESMDCVRIGKENGGMLDFRVCLYVAACRGNMEQCLRALPFPSCFFDMKTKTKDYNSLLQHVELIPALKKINENMELPDKTWQLMYWIFTNPLNVEPLFSPKMEFSIELTGAIQDKVNLKFPSAYYILEVRLPKPKPAFVDGKSAYGSFYVFHGSPFCNFQSIIHRGLLSGLSSQFSYHHGMYVSTEFERALAYANGTKTWNKSAFGLGHHCVAICEVVDTPDESKVKTLRRGGTIMVIDDDDIIQLAYLLFFSPADVQKRNEEEAKVHLRHEV